MRHTVKYTPVFTVNRKAYESGKYRYLSNQGSSRSSKTYSGMQLVSLVGQKLIGNKRPKSVSVVSPSLPHLKRGAMRDFRAVMDSQGIYDIKKHNKTDHIYNFSQGSYVEFFGAENEGKARGPGRDILYINEANLISYEMFVQLAMRTRELIIIDFNPADEYSWVYDLQDDPTCKFIHSTYKNNLANLSKFQIQEIERLKDADPNLWKVYGQGLRGSSGEKIYTHYLIINESDFPIFDEVFYGLDFGYNHPNALVKIGISDGKVYVQELMYESKQTTADLIHYMKSQLGMTSRSGIIYADSARPEIIEEICRAGFNCQHADKDVVNGIKMVQSRPLYVSRLSTNWIKEGGSYKWKIGKGPGGYPMILDEPVKFMDDLMDATRYAIYTNANDGFKSVII